MGTREIVDPQQDHPGDETHPAFGLIGASRISTSPPGSVLFDSDIRHQHSVVISIRKAIRKRDLNHDWIHGKEEIIEVELSEAQWASFVSSMGFGKGVPTTIRWTREDGQVPGLPYAPRMSESLREVDEAADQVFGKIAEALEAYEQHKTVGNLRSLRSAVNNAGSNLGYVAKSMSEHVEGVVQRARADVEAFVVQKASQLGIESSEVGEDVRELLA